MNIFLKFTLLHIFCTFFIRQKHLFFLYFFSSIKRQIFLTHNVNICLILCQYVWKWWMHLFFQIIFSHHHSICFRSKAEIERDDIGELCENNEMNTTRKKKSREEAEEEGNNRAKIDEFVLIVSIKRFR